MRALIIALALSATAITVLAQEFKDGTETALTAEQKAVLLSLLLTKVADPFSTQIIRLQQSRDNAGNYCGLLNSKNLNGAYTGFKPFRFIPDGPRIYIETDCD
ncbi:hypothetical protein JUM41_11050 [Rhizobium pusense]|uniref:hypothetical protein n=1 Tax=Agrobacterium pusense TaxID=648995 RepID=UPI001FCC26F3|nr:hypothetical protein [Agrobacterium pusense]MCJ2874772.1 hypothetical protein [Agrobacterium pusense]